MKVKQHTTIKVRLCPTAAQADTIDKTIDCCRYLWNEMLSDEREFYFAAGEHYIPTPARYRRTAPFLKEADSTALSAVHTNLRRAFQDFFRDPGKNPYPTFKRKKERRNTYRTYCVHRGGTTPDNIRLEGEGIVLPKLKWVRARLHRKPFHWWKLVYATVSRSASGKYYCSLLYEYETEKKEPVLSAERSVGLNYSVSRFYVDSSGHSPEQPASLSANLKKIDAMQRALSRMERGSRNYERALQRLRLLHEHAANQRKDFIHKESRRIANACDIVCVRDSNLEDMAKTLKLANVMGSGFGRFRDCLRYKLARAGKLYVPVDRSALSAKTCRFCGSVNEALTLRQRVWTCPSCGAKLERGLNSAINLREMGLRQLELARYTA